MNNEFFDEPEPLMSQKKKDENGLILDFGQLKALALQTQSNHTEILSKEWPRVQAEHRIVAGDPTVRGARGLLVALQEELNLAPTLLGLSVGRRTAELIERTNRLTSYYKQYKEYLEKVIDLQQTYIASAFKIIEEKGLLVSQVQQEEEPQKTVGLDPNKFLIKKMTDERKAALIQLYNETNDFMDYGKLFNKQISNLTQADREFLRAYNDVAKKFTKENVISPIAPDGKGFNMFNATLNPENRGETQ